MKLLAIDIGSAQVKVCLFDSRFNHFEFIQHQVIPLPDALGDFAISRGGLSESQINSLRQVAEIYNGKVDRIVTNVPNNLFTIRVLNFPFSDKKRITQSARFQIEDEVPFDLDKCIIAMQIFSQSSKKTSAMCAVAQTNQLRAFLETIQSQAGLDVDVITSPHSALTSFFKRQKQIFGDKSTAIINLGSRKSSICIFQNSIPVLNRTSMVGGFHISTAIAKNYNITREEAEAAKRKSGFLAPPGVEQTEEQKVFSNLIASVLDPVLHDFHQCLMAHFSRNNARIDQIFITGGTSQTPGICDYLAARWQIPTHPLDISSSFENQSHKLNSSEELVLSESLALGLSQLEGRSKQALNFRQGDLRSKKSVFDSLNLRNLAHPIRLLAIVYVVIIVSLIFQNTFLAPQRKKLQQRLASEIKSTLPSSKRSDRAKYRREMERTGQSASLKRKVNRMINDLKVQIGTSISEEEYSVLNLLRALSESVPRTVVLEIRKLNLATPNLNLELESSSQTDLESAINSIRKLKWISKGPEEPNITKNPSGFTARVTYTLEKGL